VQDTAFYEKKIQQLFAPNAPAMVMGILNITSDSFFDGGSYLSENQWLEKALEMQTQGADIIDIGACSTRPGAIQVPFEEELERIVKATELIRKNVPNVLVSVDTYRAKIAEAAVKSGAHIINDISGGTMDSDMFKTIARLKIPYILMHIQGTPQTMQQNPVYDNVVEDVLGFFNKKIAELTSLGVSKVILDPGFGFGKTIAHNYQLMSELSSFATFDLPLLVGLSRKSMIYKVLNTTPAEALNGTTVLNTIALQKGARILRVHDVKEAKETIELLKQLSISPL
jgi:dihydropteroate synthase